MEDRVADGLRLSVDGAVARVVLDRPDVRNAQTPAMWLALAEFGAKLPDDVRVVIVSGEGKSFSAGLDRNLMVGETTEQGEPLITLGTKPAGEITETIASYQAGFSWLRNPDFVSVAAVQGHAVGAGFQLALACDLRVVTPDVRFCMKEPALGLVPDLGGTQPLVDLVGYARALEICATTRWVHAEEAQQIGLANIVVPAEELEATVADLTAVLQAAAPKAVRGTKALLLGASRRTYDEQLRAERETQAQRLASLVAGEG
ncbi:MAG TPA: enoyl-CoA hydratase/isomerase family protein [Kribbellaceae bacterium]